MDENLIKLPKPRCRRKYSAIFKKQMVAACLEPGISVSAIAQVNELNVNLLRRWIKKARYGSVQEGRSGEIEPLSALPGTTLVPVTVQTAGGACSGDIRIEIHRRQTVYHVSWPASQADTCAQWLRELLR